jgi:type I restriction enzyme R subunit
LQTALVKRSAEFDDLKGDLIGLVSSLPINLGQVRAKLAVIERAKSAEFWDHPTVASLEEVRRELRSIMRFRPFDPPSGSPPKVIDVAEDDALIERRRHKVKLPGLEMAAYRNRVQNVLLEIIDDNETLQKIKAGQPVNAADLEALCSLVLTQDPSLDLHDLTEYFPESAGHLDQAIRGIIGLDARAVHQRFEAFVAQHPSLASHQIQFLDLLQNHISKYGSIEIERLYEPPFTLVASDGLDGVFDDPLAEEILQIIGTFQAQSDG